MPLARAKKPAEYSSASAGKYSCTSLIGKWHAESEGTKIAEVLFIVADACGVEPLAMMKTEYMFATSGLLTSGGDGLPASTGGWKGTTRGLWMCSGKVR